MRPLSENFQSHLDGEVTTLCNCWLVLRKDEIKLGFTDHDRQIEFGGYSFEPASGFEASQVEASTGLTPDNHEVIGALISGQISAEDIRNSKYDSARIRHYLVNWSAPEEHSLLNTYIFGDIVQEDGVFRAELKSLVAQLDQTKVRRFEKRCNADLGDNHCGVDLAEHFSHPAVVAAVKNETILEVSGVDHFVADWFTGGQANFETGDNAGSKVEIISHSIDKTAERRVYLRLWERLPNPCQIGDQIRLNPGCDKLASTCKNKFGNILNFRGFPHIPGSTYAMSYASNSEEMDGGPLVP